MRDQSSCHLIVLCCQPQRPQTPGLLVSKHRRDLGVGGDAGGSLWAGPRCAPPSAGPTPLARTQPRDPPVLQGSWGLPVCLSLRGFLRRSPAGTGTWPPCSSAHPLFLFRSPLLDPGVLLCGRRLSGLWLPGPVCRVAGTSALGCELSRLRSWIPGSLWAVCGSPGEPGHVGLSAEVLGCEDPVLTLGGLGAHWGTHLSWPCPQSGRLGPWQVPGTCDGTGRFSLVLLGSSLVCEKPALTLFLLKLQNKNIQTSKKK